MPTSVDQHGVELSTAPRCSIIARLTGSGWSCALPRPRMRLPMYQSQHRRRASCMEMGFILAMLCWLGVAPIGLRVAADLASGKTSDGFPLPVATLALAGIALLVPYLAICAISRRSPRWRQTNVTAAVCLAAGGYIVVDSALRAASPASAMTLLVGESSWTIGRRALLSVLYVALAAWAVPRLAAVELLPPRERLGLDGRLLPGLLFALGAAGIVTWPWPLTGALGDSLTSLNLLVQAIAAVVPEQLLFWGVIYSVLVRALMSDRLSAMVGVAVYAASALGRVLPAGGLSELGVTIQRLPLALLLWQLRSLGGHLGAPLAAALLTSLIPELFVDPRDAFGSGMPEVQHIAAHGASLIGMLVLSVLLRLGAPALAAARQRWKSAVRPIWPAAIGVAAGPWVVWFGLYLLLGSPRFYNHGFLIIMREQAVIQVEPAATTRDRRLANVYQSLVEIAEASQASLRAELDGLGVPYRPYYLTNMIRVDGRRWLMSRFAERADVALVILNPNVREYPRRIEIPYGFDVAVSGNLQPNLAAVGADASWALGVRGQGIVVGGQDTGYDWDHPALLAHYRGWDGESAVHDYNWHDAWNRLPVPFDDGGHGTLTMGTVLGDDGAGNRTGVAPEAQWIGCRNMRRGLGNPGSYIECMEFFLAPYPMGGDPLRDGDVTMAPHVVNNSWACPDIEGCQPDTLARAFRVLRSAGIMMIVSAGNDGPSCASVITPPATYQSAFSVGATDDDATVSSFSSRGPTNGLIKPDVTAPGDYVRSSVAGGGYGYAGGTSMASPHVAGLVALLWSANPSLIGDIDGTEALICRAAVPKTVDGECSTAQSLLGGMLYGLVVQPACACGEAGGVPNNVYGCGFIDAGEAVRISLSD